MIEAALAMAARLEETPYASRLGLRAGDLMSDMATASIPWLPVLSNAQGFVHGGVAASLSMWTAMLAAVASDRGHAAGVVPVSAAVSYLAAAREEALHATARVASRGRDIVHVGVEVASERGRPIAVGTFVMRTLPRRAALPRQAAGASRPPERDDRRLVSPFSEAMGLALRGRDSRVVELGMTFEQNRGLDGALDPGALLALADTCAALACLPSLDERLSGSATLSISAVFGAPLATPAAAVGRSVAEDGAVRSALVEIAKDGSGREARLPAMTACVSYRFLAAERQP